ncbi:MAG: DNA polymerase IV [Hyphomicrobiaceae bacterium]
MPTLCRDCCETSTDDGARCPVCGSARLVTHDEIEQLAIAHIDCDAFYAAVEKRDRPDLVPKPVIVGHAGGRGVVTTACYVARRFGARSAMPMFKALELCPQAVVVPPDMAKYREASRQVRAILETATDRIEPVSLDEAYLDLTHEHLLGDLAAAPTLAWLALRVEREVGITVSIGLSYNKFLAKLASDARKPRGYSVIGRTEARSVLAPLAVARINGVGAVMAERLARAGILTIGDVQSLGEQEVVQRIGRFGHRLALLAAGEDDRRVNPHRPTKSISAETTFRQDTGSARLLIEAATGLAERVAAQLVRKRLAGGAVVLKLKTSDFRVLSRHKRLLHPTQQAGVLIEAAQALIEKEAQGATYRLIGIGVDQLAPAEAADPPDLFAAVTPQAKS